MANYLEAEQLIKAKLETELASNSPKVHVKTAADIAGIEEDSQRTPAVYIVYDGDTVGEDAGYGQSNIVKQRYMAVITVRNKSTIRSGEKTREDAGELLSQVISILSGWKPGNGYSELKRVDSIPPGYSAGFGYFPVAFEITKVTT